jgi:FtsP/CotA-like multicopper oxidase with cupredoxin domain
MTPSARGRTTARRSARTLTRRAAIVAGGTGLAMLGLAARQLGGWGSWGTELAFAASGEPLREPPVRLSQNGVLATTIEARSDPRVGVGGMTYEGLLPGPTLRMRPGDRLQINFTNHLGGDETNLHVHGFHVSPQGNGDNVFLHLENGQTFDYEYHLPDNHPAGVYWYHPHHHGDTMQQTAAGLAGAMIVEGDFDELPGIEDVPERLLCLQGPFIRPTGVQYLVNGQIDPTIAIRPGETQRWRLLNASANTFFNLQLDGIDLHRIALDGNPLPAVWTVDTLLLAPAERAEVLVQGGLAGEYRFRSLAWGEGDQAQPEFQLATLVTAGDPVTPAPLPTTIMPLTEPLDDLTHAKIDKRRVITFTEADHAPYFGFDGKGFDPNRVDQTVALNATEEWVIRNASNDWHPFHIHVNDFQPMSINGQPQPPHYKDTIPVPPNGEVTLRMRFLDFTGKFVYHCHILAHEDAGMMGVVEVVDGASAATPSA